MPPAQVPLRAFLDHVVEGFLTFDLKQLSGSGVGYPLLMTSFGAIELFGVLLSTETYDPQRSSGRLLFVDFWSKHLYPDRAQSEEVGGALYTLVRNGIAHQFFPKGEIIGVMGPRPWEHLTVNSSGQVLIDAHALAADVLSAYTRTVRPLVGTAREAEMQERLNDLNGDPRIAKAEGTLLEILPPSPAPLVSR